MPFILMIVGALVAAHLVKTNRRTACSVLIAMSFVAILALAGEASTHPGTAYAGNAINACGWVIGLIVGRVSSTFLLAKG